MIYRKWKNQEDYINVNGNGSEISRSYYDPFLRRRWLRFDANRLSKVMKLRDPQLVQAAMANWMEGAKAATDQGYSILDMAYWELRMGRWGAYYPAQQDVAVDEFSPFCNRELIESTLGVPARLRCEPKYRFHRKVIAKLWPELLSEPFNPRPFSFRAWYYRHVPIPVQEALARLKGRVK